MHFARFAIQTGVLSVVSLACIAGENQLLPPGVDPNTGFRMERYRAPVPSELAGATVFTTSQAQSAHQAGKILFIDVYPPRGLGPDPLTGHWITNEKRENIPDSIWLPDVGRGFLDEDLANYFKRNLTRFTNQNLSKPILFYCTADCWQSWNAAKRALEWGYTDVYWYPDGTDGWQDAELELSPATPVNFLE